MNHLSNAGREIKRDSESSGERTWKSLNRLNGVAGLHGDDPKSMKKAYFERNVLERTAKGCDSHVGEGIRAFWCST